MFCCPSNIAQDTIISGEFFILQNDKKTIIEKARRSLKWSALMEVVARTASPIIFVILARLLVPADFGLVASAMVAISFAQMFWDAGLSKALIQTNEAPEAAAQVVFWSNTVLGLSIYIILFAFASPIASFLGSPGAGTILRVLGLQIIIASLSSVQQAMFVRDLNFKRLFWVKLVTAFIPGLFSIPLAFIGYGVWALVAGSLAGQTLNLCLLWHYSSWRPMLLFDMILFRKIFSFGIWVLAESFGGWLIMWGDCLIVGKFLGTHDLGVYRTGWMLVSIIFGFVLNPFIPVLYPTFSRLQHDRIALKESFHKVNRVVASLALPIGVGLLLVGSGMEGVLFGNKWQGVGFVISILGLKEAIAWLVGINVETYRAMGRPDVNTKLMFFQIFIFVPAYLVAVQFGLVVFLYVRLAVCVIAVPLHVYLCRRMLDVSPFYLWYDANLFVVSTAIMGLVVAFFKWGLLWMAPAFPRVFTLTIIIISGGVSYLAALYMLDRAFVVNTFRSVLRHGNT
jgi:PST family polysaccharide transporter